MSAPVIELPLSTSTRHQSLIRIQPDSLAILGALCQNAFPQAARCLIVTDTTVARLYGEAALKSLAPSNLSAHFETHIHTLDPGEGRKSWAAAEAIHQVALSHGLTRGDFMLALGGGVVGDITGFCAATYHRGTGLVQVPTTLMAQVDSAIGGKTGVNLGGVKNAVGAFHQPALVVIDPTLLRTLPTPQIEAGLAEVVKYTLVETTCTRQFGFFDWLAQLDPGDMASWAGVWLEIIHRCTTIKASVVARDETDTSGLRACLNLGHTFAHAYEALSAEPSPSSPTSIPWLHGQAVALGLLDAAHLAQHLALLDTDAVARIEKLLARFISLAPLQQARRHFTSQAILEKMQTDKKQGGLDADILRLILPTGPLGCVTAHPVAHSAILTFLDQSLR